MLGQFICRNWRTLCGPVTSIQIDTLYPYSGIETQVQRCGPFTPIFMGVEYLKKTLSSLHCVHSSNFVLTYQKLCTIVSFRPFGKSYGSLSDRELNPDRSERRTETVTHTLGLRSRMSWDGSQRVDISPLWLSWIKYSDNTFRESWYKTMYLLCIIYNPCE